MLLARNSSAGVPTENLRKFIRRKLTFGYLRNDCKNDGGKFGKNPTCEANNRKISRCGFHRAADSIAHVCL